jgi:tyrosyl-tRNA synthetase
LITKADGTKFGKTASGNIWLDPKKTSPYKFYQYWINTSDEDAEKFIKIFTFLPKDEIENLVKTHKEQPHLRALQSRLADEITATVHSTDALEKAKEASQVLFGKSTEEDLAKLDEATFLDVFEGVPLKELSKEVLKDEFDMIAALSAETKFLSSNGEARRALKENSISVNKSKVSLDYKLTEKDLINNKYVLINKGKKNTYLIKFD